MRTTAVEFDPAGTLASTKELLSSLPPQTKSALILSCDKNAIERADWQSLLPQYKTSFFGGIFPQVIFGDRFFEQGTVLVGFDAALPLVRVRGLNDQESDLDKQIGAHLQHLSTASSVLVWVDGLSQRIADLLASIYDQCGGDKSYLGGGAGSLTFAPSPCVFYHQEVLQGEAVLVAVENKIAVAVDHGWQKLAGPFNVTRSSRNVVESLDYQSAFSVYGQVVGSQSRAKVVVDNFFEVAKGFPFGIEQVDGSIIVRDPILTDGQSLTCVGEVAENSIVYILRGENEGLIGAAEAATKRAMLTGPSMLGLVIDCISRTLFLGDDFAREVKIASGTFSRDKTPFVGALTLGEIANSGGDALQFYNKTFVVGGVKAG